MSARNKNAPQSLDIAASRVAAPVIILIVVVVAIRRFTETFTAAGLRTWLPLGENDATALSPAFGSVTGRADSLFVTVTGVNALSTFSLGASIVIVAATWIAVAICMSILTRELIAGRAFSRRAVRSVNNASYITIGGSMLTMLFDKFAQNGVATALGLGEYDGPSGFAWTAPYVMPWAFAFFIGVLGLAFVRGGQLQKDTEGLV